jgi:hypothetical protein
VNPALFCLTLAAGFAGNRRVRWKFPGVRAVFPRSRRALAGVAAPCSWGTVGFAGSFRGSSQCSRDPGERWRGLAGVAAPGSRECVGFTGSFRGSRSGPAIPASVGGVGGGCCAGFAGMRRVRWKLPGVLAVFPRTRRTNRRTHDGGTRLGAQRQVLLVAMSVELNLDDQRIGADHGNTGIGIRQLAPRPIHGDSQR